MLVTQTRFLQLVVLSTLSLASSLYAMEASTAFQKKINHAIKKGKDEAINDFIQTGNIRAIELYCKENKNFNQLRISGWNPINIAAAYDRPEIIECLLFNNADINQMTTWDENPLLIACLRGNIDAALYLLAKGARVDVTDAFRRNPLHRLAVPSLEPKTIKLIRRLMSLGIELDSQTIAKSTALHSAQTFYNIKFCTVLILLGANLNSGDSYGKTTLHWAARHDEPQLTLLLSYFGAATDIEDKQGKTPKDFAQGECKEIITNTDKYIQQHPEKFEKLAKKIRKPFQTKTNMVRRLRNRQLRGRF